MDHRLDLFSLLLPLIVFASIEAVQNPDDPNTLYEGVFKLSKSVWDYDRIVDALGKLVRDNHALPVDDPRRAQVEYWVEAGKNDESKCTFEAHQEMMAHLESDRAKAEEMKRAMYSPTYRDVIFNLGKYVSEVSSRRFTYCQNTVGRSFELSVEKATLGDRKDLSDLTENKNKNSDRELGERVAQLLKRKLDQTTFVQVSKDAVLIKYSYDDMSPCAKVLSVVSERYSIYKLLTLPENYERCLYTLKQVLDRISVCEYIRDSKRVFEYAAQYMQQMS